MPTRVDIHLPSPTTLLAALRQVRSLRLEARSAAATGWQGRGVGPVEESEPSADVVVFVETGAWQPERPGLTAIRFNNVYRWTALEQTVRLEHLRFGPSAPVLLFDMAPSIDSEWREVSPHYCGEDRYRVSLSAEAGQMVLAWSVVGPQKQESIRYTYC